MSDENEKLIEDVFVKELGAKYPIVKTDNKAFRTYGIEAYPTYVVVDANGKVVSTKGQPSDGAIEQLLRDVVLVPALPADARYDALRSLWAKKAYAKLADQLHKELQQESLDESVRDVLTAQKAALDAMVTRRTERAAELGKGPDYHDAELQLERMQKEWQGMPPAEAAKAQLDRFAADATVKKEIAAGKALQKVLDRYDPSKLSQAKKLREELSRFAKKHEGTFAGERAQKLAQE